MSENKTKYHFNKRDCAEILGIKPNTFGEWQLPYDFKVGREVFYDIRKVMKAKFEKTDTKQGTLMQERARLAKVQADRQEMELAKEKGELTSIDVIVDHHKDFVLTTRAMLLALPSEMAAIFGWSRDQENEAEDIVHNKLEAISEVKFSITKPGSETERSSETVEATPKVNSKPVGRRKKKTVTRGKRSTG